MLLRLYKKENILIINEMNITKLTNAVDPEYYWVISFMAGLCFSHDQRFFN